MPRPSITDVNKENDDVEWSHIFDSTPPLGARNPLEEGNSQRTTAQRVERLIMQWEKSPRTRMAVEQALSFGQRIRTLRTDRGFSRKELAQRAQMDAELRFQLEKGLLTKSEIAQVLVRISIPLDVVFEDLNHQLNESYLLVGKEHVIYEESDY